jgi:hypothetical protein
MEEIRPKQRHNKAFYPLYSAPKNTTFIKSGRMRIRGLVTGMVEIRYA